MKHLRLKKYKKNYTTSSVDDVLLFIFFLCFGTWGRYCSAIIHYFELLLGFSVFHITLNDVKRDFASGAFRCQTFSSFFPLFFLFFSSVIVLIHHLLCKTYLLPWTLCSFAINSDIHQRLKEQIKTYRDCR